MSNYFGLLAREKETMKSLTVEGNMLDNRSQEDDSLSNECSNKSEHSIYFSEHFIKPKIEKHELWLWITSCHHSFVCNGRQWRRRFKYPLLLAMLK